MTPTVGFALSRRVRPMSLLACFLSFLFSSQPFYLCFGDRFKVGRLGTMQESESEQPYGEGEQRDGEIKRKPAHVPILYQRDSTLNTKRRGNLTARLLNPYHLAFILKKTGCK